MTTPPLISRFRIAPKFLFWGLSGVALLLGAFVLGGIFLGNSPEHVARTRLNHLLGKASSASSEAESGGGWSVDSWRSETWSNGDWSNSEATQSADDESSLGRDGRGRQANRNKKSKEASASNKPGGEQTSPYANMNRMGPPDPAATESALKDVLKQMMGDGSGQPSSTLEEWADGSVNGLGGVRSGRSSALAPSPTESVQIKQKWNALILEIPLARPEDEANISVKALPHAVQVSGQTQVQVGNLGKVSNTYRRSFTSTDTLIPSKMTRKYRKGKLVVTIPKEKEALSKYLNGRSNQKPVVGPVEPAVPGDGTPGNTSTPPDSFI